MVSLCYHFRVVYVGCEICVVCGALKPGHRNTAMHSEINCS